MNITWVYDPVGINWESITDLYKLAFNNYRSPEDLETVFLNSRFTCFLFDGQKLIGTGRAFTDGLDFSFIAGVAVLPDYQGLGLGKQIMEKLLEFSAGYNRIILYAAPGKEDFYRKFGFKKMTTAMAIFDNEEKALELGVLSGE